MLLVLKRVCGLGSPACFFKAGRSDPERDVTEAVRINQNRTSPYNSCRVVLIMGTTSIQALRDRKVAAKASTRSFARCA